MFLHFNKTHARSSVACRNHLQHHEIMSTTILCLCSPEP